jgi:hypothetical protein
VRTPKDNWVGMPAGRRVHIHVCIPECVTLCACICCVSPRMCAHLPCFVHVYMARVRAFMLCCFGCRGGYTYLCAIHVHVCTPMEMHEYRSPCSAGTWDMYTDKDICEAIMHMQERVIMHEIP